MTRPTADSLEHLRRRYRRELGEKCTRARHLWASAQAGDPGALAELVRHCHRLAGSGTTFGLPAVTDGARALEMLLKPLAGPGAPPVTAVAAEAERLLEALEAAAAGDTPAAEGPRVWLVGEAGAALAEDLAPYRLVLERLPEPEAAAGSAPVPDALVVCAADGVSAADLVRRARRQLGHEVPAVIVAGGGGLADRLAAWRCGAEVFLHAPAAAAEVMDALGRLLQSGDLRDAPLLLVGTDAALRQAVAAALAPLGVQLSLARGAEEALAAIAAQPPELILMETRLPGCSGPELAALIRQDPALLGVPIVLLAGQDGAPPPGTWALPHDTDGFMAGALEPELLAEEVTRRLRRYRGLRTQMLHDNLTGVLNHSAIRQRLEVEASRLGRDGGRLVYALLDLDHFRAVNEAHGHAAGDRVLRALARMLVHRLRRMDAVGRYGGEEFAVVLPGTSAAEAMGVLDGLRRDFSRLVHVHEGRSFSSSFSAGLAEAPPFSGAAELEAAAHRALHAAKQAGRNQLCIASPPA